MFARLDNRLNNTLKYESPGYFGAKLIMLYSPDEVKDVNGKAKDVFNAALLYKDATYFAAYSYYIKNNVHNGEDPDVWNRIEAGVDQQIWMLSLGFQKVNGYSRSLAYNPSAYEAQKSVLLTGAESIQGTEYSATLNYTFQEKLTYRLSYAQGIDMEINGVGVDDTGYKHMVFGANYRLSSKSKAFIDYGQVNWNGNYFGTGTRITENNLALGLTLDI
jgi:predicted porin